MRWRRTVFVLYAIALAIATHWPRLALGPPGIRIDLVYHVGAFGLWCWLLAFTAWFGKGLSRRNLVQSTLIAMGAGVLDELSQTIPVFDRQFGLSDMSANVLGALVAGLSLFVISTRVDEENRAQK